MACELVWVDFIEFKIQKYIQNIPKKSKINNLYSNSLWLNAPYK